MALGNPDRPDFRGCYAFVDGTRPFYVGISKKVIERVRQHLRDHKKQFGDGPDRIFRDSEWCESLSNSVGIVRRLRMLVERTVPRAPPVRIVADRGR